jgi:hypothetical protein
MSLSDACAALLHVANARWVVLYRDGNILGAAVTPGVDVATAREKASSVVAGADDSERSIGGHRRDLGLQLALSAIALGYRFVVAFDERSSLGLVRLRTKKALEALTASRTSGGDEGGGAPAGAAEMVRPRAR